MKFVQKYAELQIKFDERKRKNTKNETKNIKDNDIS